MNGNAGRAARAVVGVAGAVMVAVAIVRYPPPAELPFDLRPLLAFDPAKVWPLARALLGLLALNLAIWGLGRPLQRRLGSKGSLMAPEALGLGFVALADVVLLLAAARLLYTTALATVVLGLAGLGAYLLWREHRGWRPGRPGWAWLAVAALLVSPILGAWLADYGWDGFAYHLAIPERYLFRNRIVVTPLFPHTAFPHTVEMLYLLALAFDPGPLAKLLHIELGVLAAGTAWALARRASPRAGLLAVAVLAADPLFNWELGVAYNDLAAGLFGLLAAAALIEHQQGGDTRDLVRCGLFAGACVATRYPAAAVPLALVLAVWLGRGAWRPKLRRTLVIGGLTVLVLSPWMLRNLVMTGNPVAPALQGLFYERGREFFDPIALEQGIVFTRSVGPGRDWDDLLLLPVNITLRVTPKLYNMFGYRLGVLYVIGALACLLVPAARRAPEAGPYLKVAGLVLLIWFYSFQEPRYLLPALGLLAVAGGVGLDRLLPAGRRSVLWLLPIVAVLHTQWQAALLLPYRYGYALGRLSNESFRAQEPALAVAKPLRRLMGPGDRLLLVYENRGFFYRGMDYVNANWPEVMLLLHRDPDPLVFRRSLEAMGVTHLLVNTNNLVMYRTWFVPGWGVQEFEEDLRRLHAFLEQETTLVLSDRGVFVRRLRPSPAR